MNAKVFTSRTCIHLSTDKGQTNLLQVHNREKSQVINLQQSEQAMNTARLMRRLEIS